MPEVTQVEAPAGAVTETTFSPSTVTVEQLPAVEPVVVLKQFVFAVADGVFMDAYTSRLQPELAIALGEQLIAAGHKARSGLVLPEQGIVGVPA